MDTELNIIITAVQKQLDPNASTQDRQQAQQICLEFQTHPQAPVLAFHMIHNRHSPPVRHFGLHILEQFVKHAWDKFTVIEKNSIKNSLFAFLTGGTRDILEEQQFLKEKSTVLIVEIVKRDWPRQWPEFIPSLQKLAIAGETQLELALLVIRNLAMEVKEFGDDLSDNRRRELSNAILNEVDTFFSLFYRILEEYYVRYKSSLQQQQQQQQQQQGTHVARDVTVSCMILTATLRALLAFVEWTPIDAFMKQNFAVGLCNLLSEVPLRQLAAQCLLTIMERREKDKTEAEKLYFLFEFMDGITNSLKLTSNNKQQDYEFVKILCKALIALGMKQLTYFELHRLPPNYQKYLELMLDITAHPSLVLASEIIPFWTKLLSVPYYKENAGTGILCRRLLEAIDEKIPKWTRKGDVSNQFENWRGAFYWKVDFEFSDDFSEFIQRTRTKFTSFIQLIASLQPIVALEYAIQKLQLFITSFTKTCTEEKYDKNSMEYILFEACCTQLTAVMIGVKDIFTNTNDPRHSSVVELVEVLLKLIFEFQPTQPLFIVKQLQMFKCFVPYYKYKPNTLEFIVTKFFELMKFQRPHETLDKLSKESVGVRQSACYSLLHICKTLPELMVPKLERLVTIVEELFPTVIDTQKPLLIEALAAVSNGMKSYQLQEVFLSQLLGNIEEDWKMILSSDSFKNIESFLTFLHLHPTKSQNSPEKLQFAQQQRFKIQKAIQIFAFVWRQTTVPSDVADLISGGYLNPNEVITESSFFNQSNNVIMFQALNDSKNNVSRDDMNQMMETSSSSSSSSSSNERLKMMQTEIKALNKFKAKHPLTKHSKIIIEGVLTLIQHLHTLWTPQVRIQIPNEYRDIFAIDPIRVLSLIHSDSQPTIPDYDSEISRLRSWLELIRESCYSIVGSILEQESGIVIYSLPSLRNVLLNFIFSHLDFIENRHLIVLLRCVNKFLLCPPQVYNELVPILAHFCIFLLNRLSEHWNISIANTNVSLPPISTLSTQNVHSLQHEVLEEILLRKVTKDSVDFIKRFLFGSQSGTHSHQSLEPSQLFLYLLKTNMNVVHSLASGLVNALKFPDMSTFQTVITICINLLSVLLDVNNRLQLSIAQLSTHAQFVGNVMTTALLQSLAYKHGQEHYTQVLMALSTIYQHLSPPSENGLDTKIPSTQERPDFRPYFLQVFAQLPNSSDKHIHDLQQAMAKATLTSRRNIIKNFLVKVCGLKLGDTGTKVNPADVAERPSQSTQKTKPPQEDSQENNPTSDVRRLFDKS